MSNGSFSTGRVTRCDGEHARPGAAYHNTPTINHNFTLQFWIYDDPFRVPTGCVIC